MADERGDGSTHAPRPRRADLQAVKRPPEFDEFVGKWIAVKNGRVVESANTAIELVDKVRRLGDEGDDAVVEYVAPPSGSWMVGVG